MAQAALLSEQQKELNWRKEYPWLVGVFYLFQGFYFVGMATYTLAIMANWGLPPPTQASVTAVLALPLYVKVIPSLLSDRMPIGRWGRRKPYIFIGGLLYIPGFIFLITYQRFGAAWMGSILLILIAWLLVDSPLDALTVDITPKDRSAQIRSAASAGRLFGSGISSLVVPILGPRIGWTSVLVILGTGALISSGAALLLRDNPVSRVVLQQEMPLREVLRKAFGRPLVWLSIFFFLFFTTWRVGRLINIYLLTELGWSGSPEMMTTYGVLSIIGRGSGVLGALLAGRLPAKWLTSFKFYAGFLMAIWILTAPWLAVNRAPDSLWLIYVGKIARGVVSGMSSVLMAALVMRVCPKSIEGFTFALMSSVMNFSNATVGPKTATAFSDQLGLIPSIFTLIPYGLLSLVFLYPLLKQLNRSAKEQIVLNGAASLPAQ